MTLKEYMKSKGYTYRLLSDQLGIDQAQLCRYVQGTNVPSLHIAYDIYMRTNKKVKMESWINGNHKDRRLQNSNTNIQQTAKGSDSSTHTEN
jgi:transcriptional regulator with XRE-family HTH domain